MYDIIMLKHLRKVNKIVIPIMWILGVIVLLIGIFSKSLSEDLFAIISIISAATISTVLLVMNKYDKFICFIIITALVIGTVFAIHFNGSNALICLFICVSISALYLEKSVFIFNSIVINIGIIVLDFFKPILDNVSFIEIMIIFNVCLLILLFLIQWGKELIISSAAQSKKAEDLLHELQNNVNVIKASTNKLNKDILECDTNMQLVINTSKEIFQSFIQ